MSLFVVYSQVSVNDFVNDYSGVISESENSQIISIAKEIYDSKQAEYSVVIVNSTEGEPIEDYAISLVQGKLGNTEKSNGVLLLVAINDRTYRFEVGKGIEGTLNDAKVGRLGRNYLVPEFKQNNYGKGILDASNALKDILLNNATNFDQTAQTEEDISSIISVIVIVFFIIFMISAIKAQKQKSKYFRAADNLPWIIGSGGFAGSMNDKKKGRGGFGGFGGSGGSSGGFGGGGFGGGGSSGGW